MDRNDTPDTNSSQVSTPAWFAQTEPGAGTPSPMPPKKSKRWLVLVGGLLVVMILGLVVALLSSRSVRCFDASNYEALADIVKTVNSDTTDTADLESHEAFYTLSVYFQQDTAEFETENSDDPTMFLQSIGAYYQTQHANAPITIQITTSYTSADERSLARERSDRVKTILLEAGFDASVISAPQPTLLELNDESVENDDVADGRLPVLVSIAPLLICTD